MIPSYKITDAEKNPTTGSINGKRKVKINTTITGSTENIL